MNNSFNTQNTYYPYGIPQYTQRYPQQEYMTTNYNVAPVYLKGRPVASLEEARASQIDLDGSIHFFPDTANDKIYTKQIDKDGKAVLITYKRCQEDENLENEYVTKKELYSLLEKIIPKENTLISAKPKEEFKF